MLDNLKKYKVVLASNSPRRKELLGGLGIGYEVKTMSDIDESYPDGLCMEEVPVYIARSKADAYRPLMQPDELIITADTIVWLDGVVMGKPKDEEEACDMLRRLSGQTHQVVTGVCPLPLRVLPLAQEGEFCNAFHLSLLMKRDEKFTWKLRREFCKQLFPL